MQHACSNASFKNALAPYVKLPADPTNKEGGTGNYLGDDAPTDQGHYYWSDGQRYILGTNLESNANRNHAVSSTGNYQIRVGI